MRARYSTGVTLIELIIGLALVALLLTLGLPSISIWMQNTQLRNAAESIQNGLQVARAEAVRQNTQVSFNMAGPDSSWSVNVENPPAVVQSRAAAEGTANAQIATTNPKIVFNGLGKPNLGATATIQVTNPTGGACAKDNGEMRCLNLTVSVGGQIKMCDPKVDKDGDTRKC